MTTTEQKLDDFSDSEGGTKSEGEPKVTVHKQPINKEFTKKEIENEKLTSLNPSTKIPKNPHRVAAGKALAERNRQAREAKKILDLQREQQAQQAQKTETDELLEEANDNVRMSSETSGDKAANIYLIGILGLLVSIIGLYYKAKEYQALKVLQMRSTSGKTTVSSKTSAVPQRQDKKLIKASRDDAASAEDYSLPVASNIVEME